ncbi:hypothetical protein [Hymenobacter psychrotolerans]|uniref:Uncharacterized protein n=1 Tax=Hymenobacter psychrotolerans DSM 18569 TaxID=1121959 RepID=A0A1M7H5R4_9BACT|nr:hypothetical protein [Hymenobacter psychrotolerans]SHM23723.1 hypothetical protein SAMN02746009_04160 [Hymenobacter psychrotolerans DSM 18569]
MNTLLFFDIRGLAAAELWAYGTGALVVTAVLLALVLNRQFGLLLVGYVAASAWGIAGARLLFVSQASGVAAGLGLAFFFAPAGHGVYRLFVQRRAQTLEYFGY